MNCLLLPALRSEVNYKLKRLSSVTFQRFFCVTLDIGSTLAAAAAVSAAPTTEPVKVVPVGGKGRVGGSGRLLPIEQCLDLYFGEEVRYVRVDFSPLALIALCSL